MHGAAVVHECALQCYAGLGRPADVVVGGDELDILIDVETVSPGRDGVEVVAGSCKRGRVIPVCGIGCHIRTGALELCFDVSGPI